MLRKLFTATALGAAAMYIFDPVSGQQRRNALRDVLDIFLKSSETEQATEDGYPIVTSDMLATGDYPAAAATMSDATLNDTTASTNMAQSGRRSRTSTARQAPRSSRSRKSAAQE